MKYKTSSLEQIYKWFYGVIVFPLVYFVVFTLFVLILVLGRSKN